MEQKQYVVHCAGCHERRVFDNPADLAAWASQHRCWLRGEAA